MTDAPKPEIPEQREATSKPVGATKARLPTPVIWYGRFLHWSLRVLSVLMCLVFAMIIAYLISQNTDATAPLLTAIGSCVALTSLSFSWARCLPESAPERTDILFAGERFLHAVILGIMGTILQFAFVTWLKPLEILVLNIFIYGFFVGPLLAIALLSAHTGFRLLNNSLWSRYPRHKEWDKLL